MRRERFVPAYRRRQQERAASAELAEALRILQAMERRAIRDRAADALPLLVSVPRAAA